MSERINRLIKLATQIRRDVVNTIYFAGDGHPGPSLSIADIETILDDMVSKNLIFCRKTTSKGNIRSVKSYALHHAGFGWRGCQGASGKGKE